MFMSDVIVYTIDKENMVIEQFNCEREYAILMYHNKKTDKGRYLIANPGDDIKLKFRRKPLKDVRHSSESQSSLL